MASLLSFENESIVRLTEELRKKIQICQKRNQNKFFDGF